MSSSFVDVGPTRAPWREDQAWLHPSASKLDFVGASIQSNCVFVEKYSALIRTTTSYHMPLRAIYDFDTSPLLTHFNQKQ
eukprot:6596175-Karenia_brevis.AAC.1